jgi:1,4-dihydroxy-2-naphthoyl-CoA hydrolase
MSERIREGFKRAMQGRLPGLLGVEIRDVRPGRVESRLEVRPDLLAPNDFLHAGTVVTLADTSCGVGCIASLPDHASGFTTVELKANFIRTAEAGVGLACEAVLAHGGRTIQLWDATVTREGDGKPLALFRCTQYLLQADDPRTARQQEQRAGAGPGKRA